GGGADPELSRETAYLINAYRSAAAVGAPQRKLLKTAVHNALGHLAKWRTHKTGYVKPFMTALTMEALIYYADQSHDKRVLPAVEKMATWERTHLWDATNKKFPYIACWA